MAKSAGRSAALVAAGIMLSRLFGLVRQRVFSHYLGLTDANDAVTISFRIPNLLQNLFGEGVLSASFIPVYARLLADGDEEEAGRVAGAVFGLLALVVAVFVALGMVFTPAVVSLLAAGFTGPKRDLTIVLVRILFPSTGLLVLSAWCLGVLNSHRRFFLSYSAPVVWNVAIIAAVVAFRHGTMERIAVAIAWGAVVGAALQVVVQLPWVIALSRGLRISATTRDPNVRTVVSNFWPALLGRGVNQISAFVDAMISSLLPTGAVAALGNAQTLYTLPVSLFGMSISAAELPEMSAAGGNATERHAILKQRLEAGLERIAFFVVPCVMAFLALGEALSTIVFQSGRFTQADSRYVWAILAGSAVGLLASTLSRLTSSTFYALRDTRTPLRFAIVRVVLTGVLGFLCAVPLPGLIGVEARYGAVGLTASAGFSAWIEYLLLTRAITGVIGKPRLSGKYVAKLWVAAVIAAFAGWAIVIATHAWRPFIHASLAVAVYCAVYGGVTLAMKIPTARALAPWSRRSA